MASRVGERSALRHGGLWRRSGCRQDLSRVADRRAIGRCATWAGRPSARRDRCRLGPPGLSSAGFRILRQPAALKSSAALRAAQVVGPAGEVVYLTQRLKDLEAFDLPAPVRDVDRAFVAVLATKRIETARAPYEALGGRRASDHLVAIGVLNDAFGLPVDHRQRLSSVQLDGQCLVEIDEYPSGVEPSARLQGELPWGVPS